MNNFLASTREMLILLKKILTVLGQGKMLYVVLPVTKNNLFFFFFFNITMLNSMKTEIFTKYRILQGLWIQLLEKY